ncbi:protein phosphatase 1G [Thecamonas trahens ATCC 50062]|uniref:Protein phosphatase 1G n=1 Tax=Thecamonas trahens ATCC 50062 TaxID=461836 RepID=A0A0L0DE53_THETB|nr:protein phosphatase 1G [Thecamonas trahens ATCC 50062]KNC50597.1 protein phosphatase 1G [Thecamonas trahens ATCC 50062]|eukprot:XP_013762484.1 protein phosphatase 1G [Thecamonas trahens ATCC 50062]
MGQNRSRPKADNELAQEFATRFVRGWRTESKALAVPGRKELVEAVVDVLKAVPREHAVLELSFACIQFDPPAWTALVGAATASRGLSQLVLASNGLSARHAPALAGLVVQAPSLLQLSLEGNRLGLDGLAQVLRVVPMARILRDLNISACVVRGECGDELVDLLVEAYAGSSTLEMVAMRECNVSWHGFAKLEAALDVIPQISYVDLVDNPLSGVNRERRVAFAAALERNAAVWGVVKGLFDAMYVEIGAKRRASFAASQIRPGRSVSVVDEQPERDFAAQSVYKSLTPGQRLIGRSGTPATVAVAPDVPDALPNVNDPRELEASFASPALTLFAYDMQGRRQEMEDSLVTVSGFGGSEAVDVLGVFDGHGSTEPSRYATRNLLPLLARELAQAAAGPSAGAADDSATVTTGQMRFALSSTFVALDKLMTPWAVYSGTTGLVVARVGRALVTANAGDSRAVLGLADGSAIRLSEDHKPELASEKSRIEEAGGFVEAGRVNGRLGVARALGDGLYGDAVTAQPGVTVTSLEPGVLCVILACDGVWDVLPCRRR